MNLSDFTTLKKLMDQSMTAPAKEAAQCLDQANKILKANKLTWTIVFSRVVKVESKPIIFTGTKGKGLSVRQIQIEDLLKSLEFNENPFVLDVAEQYVKNGNLSDKQIEALENIVHQDNR